MEWIATTEDASQSAASISRAFEVLRKIPPRPVTKRLSKLALRKAKGISQYEETESDEEAGEQHGTITDLDLAAFPPLSRNESIASRRLRAEAYTSTSRILKDKYTEFCKNLDEDDFNRLWGDFVSHQSPAELEQARSLVEAGRRPAGMKDAADPFAVPPALPAAVLSSRGIGSEADDCDMFPRLISFLREKKAYVATLKAKDLVGGVGAALHSMLQQLLPPDAEDWGAHDIEALYAWYLDEAGVDPSTSSPSLGRARPAPVGPAPYEETAVAVVADDDGPSPQPRRAAASRQLRQRKTTPAGKGKSKSALASPPADATLGGLFGTAQRNNRGRPLVLLIQATEQADINCLRDLIKVFNQDHPRFPVCLILSASTPIDVVCASFSADMLSGLKLASFHRVTQEERLNRFFQDVVLSVDPVATPLALSLSPMELLLDRYHKTDGCVNSIWKALDLAAMEHCRGCQLSALASAALSGDPLAIQSAADVLPQEIVRAAAAKIAASAPAGAAADVAGKAKAVPSVRGRGERGARTSRGAGSGAEGGEVLGPASAESRLLVEAAEEAGAGWAAWRLGMLWTCLIADKTGAKSRTEFQLQELYIDSARGNFFPPSSSIHPTDPASSHRGGGGGPRMIRLLTGPVDGGRGGASRGAMSVRSLSNEDCVLSNMIEELIQLAEMAMQACQGSALIREASEMLKQLFEEDAARNKEVLASSPSAFNKGPSVRSSKEIPVSAPGAGPSKAEGPEIVREGGRREAASGSVRGYFPVIPAAGGLSPPTSALRKVALKTPPSTAVVPEAKAAAPAAATTSLKTSAVMKQERNAAMLKAAKAAGAGGKTADRSVGAVEAAQDVHIAPKHLTLQDNVADFLAEYLPLLLGSCPFKQPGASVFTYGRTWELQSQLLYAPRAAVHEALLRPHTFLGGPEQDIGLGLENTALAYRLLLGQDTVDVAQWFEEFCAAYGRGGGESLSLGLGGDVGDDGQPEALGLQGRGRSRAKGRRLGRRHSPEGDRDGETTTGARPPPGRGRSVGKRAPTAGDGESAPAIASPALTEEEQEERALRLAARFSQAVAELQFIGVCRPNKRRKAASTMQRMFYPPESMFA